MIDPTAVLARRRAAHGLCCAAALAAATAQAKEPPPAFAWTGAYLGFNLGAGFPLRSGERLQAAGGFFGPGFDLAPPGRERPGLSFGAQAGYNWRIGRLIYGVETDFNLIDGRGGPSGLHPAPAAYAPFGLFAYTLSYEQGAEYFGSLRARLGIAFDRLLIYGTAGAAVGGARGPASLAFHGAAAPPPLAAPDSQSMRMKYVIGAGAEYALFDAWSARLEYFFLNRATQTQLFANDAGAIFKGATRNENHVLRLGLNRLLGEENETGGGHGAPAGAQRNGDQETYSLHGQITNVLQGYPKFPALYSGPNSFDPTGEARFGATANLFMGLRLWKGGAVYVNPELDFGYGLSNSTGAGSYVNGAVAKVGSAAPYMRFQRYFLRQIVGLNGGTKQHDPDEGSFSEILESTQNQISGKVDKNRLVLTLGKFAVGDVFDDNVYAHDPTTGFLNFAFNTLGPFDYAADAWGYTHGLALEWKQDWWTARAGAFQLSTVPNGLDIEPVLFRQYMGVGEFEARFELFGQPGALKFLGYGDNGYLSKLDEIVALAYASGDLPPRVDALRRRRVKTGGGVNLKQQIAPGLGFFLRAGVADGRYETVDYTDIDRSVSAGLVASGNLWGRDMDEIGVAAAASGLHPARVRYFASGGASVYIGDGALSYAGEKNFEAYYKFGLRRGLDATLDYQLLVDPAHNRDRGPINVFGLRLHGQF